MYYNTQYDDYLEDLLDESINEYEAHALAIYDKQHEGVEELLEGDIIKQGIFQS